MLNREIPFRPRLEGDFRIRFYNAVSRITEDTTLADIENIADEEIKWVTSECTFNLDQRKKYRAVWFFSGTLSMPRGRRYIEMVSST